MFYLIRETLEPCEPEAIQAGGVPYAAVVSKAEWEKYRDLFGMGMDIESEPKALPVTRAVVNYDSLTGSFAVPARSLSDDEE